ncbi:hypothetical protein PR048_002106 [Dryococelus australis]|uniref:Uncharacterized protein n=1 Tax=Dryococelus australis TaxID=614101 RepID=A0ABQ9IJA7_9NEOP|nr:hypothetical protein PR048_002106 [Dryococelus australis]
MDVTLSISFSDDELVLIALMVWVFEPICVQRGEQRDEQRGEAGRNQTNWSSEESGEEGGWILTDIDYAVVGKLPAGLKSQDAERVALLGREVAKRSVSDVVRLQRELVE